jgi:RNA polymerase sigma-70 factor (ECF subfamily)
MTDGDRTCAENGPGATPVPRDPRATAPVAWSDVAARLRPYLARRVDPSDVDDVLQDVLLRMHRGLGALRNEDRFAGWMFRIANSAIAERGRDRQRHPVADAEPAEVPVARDPDRTAADALARCLTIFVARLPSPYREAITLVELEGMTVRAAAEVMGVSISGAKSRVQRGRARLRELLEACCEIAVDARGGVSDVMPRATSRCGMADPVPSIQRRSRR